MENIKSIENEIISKIEKADNEKALEEIRISELGKKGRISNILKKVGSLSPDERKEIGSSINTLKKIITEKRKYLDVIANGLIEYETLTGDEINNLLEGVKPNREEPSEENKSSVTGSLPKAGKRKEPSSKPGLQGA